ncbi:MAG TPA: glycosyltransferase, partial [Anaerolineae bacterium]
IIQTDNQGLARACNNGIRESTGEYILTLDADDRIASTYMEKAVAVLDADANVGIVYCEAEFFGDRTGKWELQEYRFPNILLGNMIFDAGFFRRADWQRVNGYNPNMKNGLQDHDFWLSLIDLGRTVYRIPETLFYYRQHSGSMINSFTREKLIALRTQLFDNHPALYSANMRYVFEHMLDLYDQVVYFQTRAEELQQKLNSLDATPDNQKGP